MIETIALDGGVATHSLCNVVAQSMFICFVRLPGRLSRDIESPCMTISYSIVGLDIIASHINGFVTVLSWFL